MEIKSNTVFELSQSFPDDIVMEILMRLPVKSLVRFRCVSKSWLYLISNPTFIKLHLNTSMNNNMYSHHSLICVSSYPRNHFRDFSLRFLLDGTVIDSNYPVSNHDISMRIVGSCRGMVCISLLGENLVLWNPSIGKFNCLPYLRISSESGCYMKGGFGYDEFNDDYKVVAIFFSMFHCGPYKVSIFSLKANKWTRIEDFEHGTPIDISGKYANGKLHWLADHDDGFDIVSLDLASERYEKLSVPHILDDGSCMITEFDGPCLTLGLFSGSLCLLLDDNITCMHLWVMKEYGIRDSWSRLFVIPHMGTPGFFPHMLRLWVLENDEILFSYGCVLVIYNLKDNVFRYPPIDDIAAIHQADVYVESLVSPITEDANHHEK